MKTIIKMIKIMIKRTIKVKRRTKKEKENVKVKEDELDPTQYFGNRLSMVNNFENVGLKY